MGRYVGWIALASGIAGGADVILIPEIPYDREEVCQKILRRKKKGCHSSIVVVSEGAKEMDGTLSILQSAEEGGCAERLGGAGEKVGLYIKKNTGIDVRVTTLGHVQRGGTPNAFDRILTTRFGVAAVKLIINNQFGRMVCLKGQDIESVPLSSVAGGQKKVPTETGLVITAEEIGVNFGRKT